MYLPALPALARDFQASDGAAQHTLALFFAGFALGQLVVGPLSDRYGRKRPLYAGLVLYAVASVGCALAPYIGALAVLRFMQAVGACTGIVISRAMVRDLFDPPAAVRVYASLMLVMGAAPILAPLLGGYLLVWTGWRAIFWALAAVGVLCLALAARLPETHAGGPAHPLALRPVLGGYAQLLTRRHYMGYALSGGLATAGMFAYIAGAPFVMIDVYGVPAQHFGWIFGANALGLIAASQLNGRVLHHRVGADRVLYWAGGIQAAAGLALLMAALTGWGGLAGLLVPLFFYVGCIGMISPNATALAMAPYGRNAGSASALLGSLQFGMAALSAALMGVLHAAPHEKPALPMAAVIAACGLLALAAHAVMIRPRRDAGSV